MTAFVFRMVLLATVIAVALRFAPVAHDEPPIPPTEYPTWQVVSTNITTGEIECLDESGNSRFGRMPLAWAETVDILVETPCPF